MLIKIPTMVGFSELMIAQSCRTRFLDIFVFLPKDLDYREGGPYPQQTAFRNWTVGSITRFLWYLNGAK